MELKTRTNQPVEGDEIGNLKVAGDLQAFENIIDADGHKRFQEWNLITEELTGVTFSFAKVSLSGTHIMFVFAGEVASGTSLANNVKWTSLQLPEWIYNKIVDVGGGVVTQGSHPLKDGTTTILSNNQYYMKKESSNGVSFYRFGDTTGTTAKGYFRVQFELLID